MSLEFRKLYLVQVINSQDIVDPIFNNVTIKRSLPPGMKLEVGELSHSGFVAKGNYNNVGIIDFDGDEILYTALYFDGTGLRVVSYNPRLSAFQSYFEVCLSLDDVVAVVLDVDGGRFFKTLRNEHSDIDNIFFRDGDWNNDDNWAKGSVTNGPATNVLIEAQATIPSNCMAEVNAITIDAGKLTVKDGGQLVHSNERVQATVEKDIAAFTNDNDGWNFIASPLFVDTTPTTDNGFLTNTYDLYYLDEENTYWRNFKDSDNSLHPNFYIEPQQGYLYANSEGTTLQFAGTLQHYVEQGISIPLTHEGQGWNLVGNPFAFAACADRPDYVINGRNVEASEGGAVPPCTGIVVKAESSSDNVRFTKEAPAQASAPSGNLNIVLAEANSSRGGSTAIDNAIVSFSEGAVLSKFHFMEQPASLCIPQGDEDYAIVSIGRDAKFCVPTEIPLNFKATKDGPYTLSIKPEGVEMGYLHLIDNMTGTDVDLLTSPACGHPLTEGDVPLLRGQGGLNNHATYTFTAKTTDYESRFKLVFAAAADETSANHAFAFVNNGNIIVNGEGTLQVVDVTGRVIRTVGLSQCGSRTTTSGMTAGVYVLRLVNGNDVKTQKIVIE